MGGKVSVIGKINNQPDENKFIELYKARRLYNLSFMFMYLLDSQFYDVSPFKQIQSKLDIDLTLFISFPEILLSPKIRELENKISKAKYEKDKETISELELKLNFERERVIKESKDTLEGWTSINVLIETTESLLSKFMKFDDLESEIVDPYNGFRNVYFSKKEQEHLNDMRFEDDLEMVIKQLKCYKEAGFSYACIFLYDGKYVGPLASFINQYDEKYKWKILG